MKPGIHLRPVGIFAAIASAALLLFVPVPASAGHDHRDPFREAVRLLDKQTDVLLKETGRHLKHSRRHGSEHGDRFHGAVRDLEKEADHIRSAWENGRPACEIERHVVEAREALACARHCAGHLRLEHCIECALRDAGHTLEWIAGALGSGRGRR